MGRNNCQGRCTKRKCKDCCKSFTAFLFSTLGLVIMVVAYSIAGGFLFQKLELENDVVNIRNSRIKAEQDRKVFVKKLWVLTKQLSTLYKPNWTQIANDMMYEFQVEVYQTVIKDKWDGKTVEEDPERASKWTYAGSFLYAVTTITTIGYGHVTPITPEGQVVTIAYCIIGLPLTLMCIANVGKFFARLFRILYHTCCCGICCVCCLARMRKKAAKKRLKNDDNSENEADLDTMGNGSALTITNDPAKKRGSIYHINITKAQVWLRNVKAKFTHSMRDDVTVPIYLCILVMALYIFGGALLFSLWEGWDYLTSSYFCFVTLTTIGFGDFVPGRALNPEDKESTERLILCSVYLLFGLSLVGMCIDLMQADVILKVKWLATKIGIIKSKKVTPKNSIKREKSIKKDPPESEQLLPVPSTKKSSVEEKLEAECTVVTIDLPDEVIGPPPAYSNDYKKVSVYDELPTPKSSQPTTSPHDNPCNKSHEKSHGKPHSSIDQLAVPDVPAHKPVQHSKTYHDFSPRKNPRAPSSVFRREASESNMMSRDLELLDKILEDPIFSAVHNKVNQNDSIDRNILSIPGSEFDDIGIVITMPPDMTTSQTSDI